MAVELKFENGLKLLICWQTWLLNWKLRRQTLRPKIVEWRVKGQSERDVCLALQPSASLIFFVLAEGKKAGERMEVQIQNNTF